MLPSAVELAASKFGLALISYDRPGYGRSTARPGRSVADAADEADKAVPPAFGHWLAERIPGVDARFPADDDHGSIHDRHLAEAYDWLRCHI